MLAGYCYQLHTADTIVSLMTSSFSIGRSALIPEGLINLRNSVCGALTPNSADHHWVRFIAWERRGIGVLPLQCGPVLPISIYICRYDPRILPFIVHYSLFPPQDHGGGNFTIDIAIEGMCDETSRPFSTWQEVDQNMLD